MPHSAVDSVSPAIEHAKSQLFRPFRLGQWSPAGAGGIVAREKWVPAAAAMQQFQLPPHTGGGHHDYLMSAFPDPWVCGPLSLRSVIADADSCGFCFMYLNSRMRFVLFDSVIAKRCEIRRMWAQRGEPAMRYFLWQIVFALVSLAGWPSSLEFPR